MALRPEPPILDVLEEHLEEAAFLWGQRRRAMASPSHTLAEVAAGPEARLQAHLDGLALAVPGAVELLLLPAIGSDDPDLAFAAAATLAAPGLFEPVGDAAPEEPMAVDAVARALSLALPAGAEEGLRPWLARAGRPAQAIALAVLARRGGVAREVLVPFLASGDATLRAAALRAATAHGEQLRTQVEASLDAAVPAVRDAAITAALRAGLRSGLEACRRVVDAGEPSPELALAVLAMSAEGEDAERIGGAIGREASRRPAIFAAGLSGRPALGDRCLELLFDDSVAPLAWEALAAIAGAAVAGVPSATPPEADEEAPVGPSGPEAELPFPDADLVESAWQRLRPALADGRRFLRGEPLELGAALRALDSGTTRRRRSLLLELELRSRGAIRIDTGAWAVAQLAAQAALGAGMRADLAQPLGRLLKG